MPRPSKGLNARNITAQVRITAHERDDLILAAGSVGRGLRALIDEKAELGQVVPVHHDTTTHRHKRDHVIAEQYIQGVKTPTWVCACGAQL